MQKSRMLTLRLVVENEEESKDLWDCFGKGKIFAGCKLEALGDGDYFKEVEKLGSSLEKAVDLLNKNELLYDEKKIEELEKAMMFSSYA